MDDRSLAALADECEAEAYADLFAAAPPALAAPLGLRCERHQGATALMARAVPTSMFNRVIGLGVHQHAGLDDLAHWQERFRAEGGRPWWIHVGPFAEPAKLQDWLVARGFAAPRRRSWAKVWRGTDAPPSVHTTLAAGPVQKRHLAEAAAAIAQAFEMPPFMGPWIASLHGRPRWRLYSVCEGDLPVGGGALFIHRDMAWLGMGAVLETHRRRGGQGALMALRIADALDSGCKHLFTETGEPVDGEPNPSLANMFRGGFRTVASRRNLQAP
jgi:hypothetical protein